MRNFRPISIAVFALISFAALPLSASRADSADAPATLQRHHTLELSFRGPDTSETATPNPFADYRLLVRFALADDPDHSYLVRGFYAADGQAAETGAVSGDVWQARFTPDRLGEWTYQASLRQGTRIALDDDSQAGAPIDLANASGRFTVTPSQATGPDFRARGRLIADGPYFRFKDSGKYWLKGGADSPENFLAYADFDGTYRYSDKAREGEAAPSDSLHRYEPHIQDWTTGDPTWRDGKGKGIIGAVNYLASTGMNAIYFLAMNIEGDGKDVWPYRDHEDVTRFDCSKLDQWEIVFRHMQSRGVLMHLVTQETENERLLDDGDTGPQRKLYYRELIARFGHHLGLVWNLGEENGPADWSPRGQTSEQQRAMASYLAASDPYHHPVVIHTHSRSAQKDELLPPLLGHQPLDGLSFQIDDRRVVHDEIVKWRARSAESGHPWLITMDEIGMWHTGVVPDAVDPDHDELRRYVLWGALLGGASGVEWYFGAHTEGNDLTTEDWRSRANIWAQTRHALDFFEEHLPYWQMASADALTADPSHYCLAKPGELYAIYTDGQSPIQLDLASYPGEYTVKWYPAKRGGPLQTGSVSSVSGQTTATLGQPPASDPATDWIALVRKR